MPSNKTSDESTTSLITVERQIIAFSHVVSKLIMARERVRQAYLPSPGADADERRDSRGMSVPGELERAFALMDEACAAWYSRPTRKTAETAAAHEAQRQINLRNLERAHAARLLSGKLGGRPPKHQGPTS